MDKREGLTTQAPVQNIPGLYEALWELARTHTVWTPEGGLFTDGHAEEWRKVRMAINMNVNPSPVAHTDIASASDGDGVPTAFNQGAEYIVAPPLAQAAKETGGEAALVASAIAHIFESTRDIETGEPLDEDAHVDLRAGETKRSISIVAEALRAAESRIADMERERDGLLTTWAESRERHLKAEATASRLRSAAESARDLLAAWPMRRANVASSQALDTLTAVLNGSETSS